MTEGAMTITTNCIRTYANWPKEVPDELLNVHLAIASRDLQARFGGETAPSGFEEDYNELLKIAAIQSAAPWLHMITLDGVSKAGRLEGEIEFRFMDADEINALLKRLEARQGVLEARIDAALSTEDADATASTNNIHMMVI